MISALCHQMHHTSRIPDPKRGHAIRQSLDIVTALHCMSLQMLCRRHHILSDHIKPDFRLLQTLDAIDPQMLVSKRKPHTVRVPALHRECEGFLINQTVASKAAAGTFIARLWPGLNRGTGTLMAFVIQILSFVIAALSVSPTPTPPRRTASSRAACSRSARSRAPHRRRVVSKWPHRARA